MDNEKYISDIKFLCKDIIESEDISLIEKKIEKLEKMRDKQSQFRSGYEFLRSISPESVFQIRKWSKILDYDDDGDGIQYHQYDFSISNFRLSLKGNLGTNFLGRYEYTLKFYNDKKVKILKDSGENASELDFSKIKKVLERLKCEKYLNFVCKFLNETDFHCFDICED